MVGVARVVAFGDMYIVEVVGVGRLIGVVRVGNNEDVWVLALRGIDGDLETEGDLHGMAILTRRGLAGLVERRDLGQALIEGIGNIEACCVRGGRSENANPERLAEVGTAD